MNKPILGKDVLFQVYKSGSYRNYMCATSVEIDFSSETKETKTIGDGTWKRKRTQSHNYRINLEGVIVVSDTSPTVFDILDYYADMVDVAYRMLFSDLDGGFRLIEGNALPTNVNLGGGSEGHGTGNVTLEGSGRPSIRTSIEMCPAIIDTAHYFKAGLVHHFSIDELHEGSGTITRYDYSIDGGGVQSAFTPGTLPWSFAISVPGLTGSSHTIRIVPICENGFEGQEYNYPFIKE